MKVYSNTGLFDGYFFYKEGIEIPVRASSITPDSMKVAHDAGIKERYYVQSYFSPCGGEFVVMRITDGHEKRNTEFYFDDMQTANHAEAILRIVGMKYFRKVLNLMDRLQEHTRKH